MFLKVKLVSEACKDLLKHHVPPHQRHWFGRSSVGPEFAFLLSSQRMLMLLVPDHTLKPLREGQEAKILPTNQ